MSFYRKTDSAKFCEYQRFFPDLQFPGAEIDMAAVHVGFTADKPPGGRINETTVIQGPQFFINSGRIKLAPALVKDGPVDNAGVVFQSRHRGFHSSEKSGSGNGIRVYGFVASAGPKTKIGQNCVPKKTVVAIAHHVLKYGHAKTVTSVVEKGWFYLNMLSQSVEAQGFHCPDVLLVSGRGGGGKDSVAPVTLIQDSMEKVGLAIETKAFILAYLFDLQGAQSKVTFYLVFACLNEDRVEKRAFWAPETGLRRTQNGPAFFQRDRKIPRRIGYRHRTEKALVSHIQYRFFQVAGEVQPLYVPFRYAFQPDRLPQAGNGGVPHSAGFFYLFAAGQHPAPQIVPGPKDQLVFAGQHCSGDVKGGCIIAAGVTTQELTV